MRPGQIQGAVGILGQRGGEPGVRQGCIPVASAEVSLTQMRQTRNGIGRRDSGTQPSGGGAQIGDGAGQVIDIDLQHPAHDQRVDLGPGYVVGGGREEVENGQTLGHLSRLSQRVGVRRPGHGPEL